MAVFSGYKTIQARLFAGISSATLSHCVDAQAGNEATGVREA